MGRCVPARRVARARTGAVDAWRFVRARKVTSMPVSGTGQPFGRQFLRAPAAGSTLRWSARRSLAGRHARPVYEGLFAGPRRRITFALFELRATRMQLGRRRHPSADASYNGTRWVVRLLRHLRNSVYLVGFAWLVPVLAVCRSWPARLAVPSHRSRSNGCKGCDHSAAQLRGGLDARGFGSCDVRWLRGSPST